MASHKSSEEIRRENIDLLKNSESFIKKIEELGYQNLKEELLSALEGLEISNSTENGIKNLEGVRKQIKEAIVICQTKLLIDLFLKTNSSDIELSKMTGISASTIGRRLINEQVYRICFGNNYLETYERVRKNRQDNLQKGKEIGGQTTFLNHGYLKNQDGEFNGPIPKLRLDYLIEGTKLSEENFLRRIALHFRLQPATLAKLFQIDEKSILDSWSDKSGFAYKSLLYLITMDTTNQMLAQELFMSFYIDALNARKNKNVKRLVELLNIILDKKALELMKREPHSKINDEAIGTMISYQLKYALSTSSTAKLFNANKTSFSARCTNYVKDKGSMEKDLRTLQEFHQSLYEKYKDVSEGGPHRG